MYTVHCKQCSHPEIYFFAIAAYFVQVQWSEERSVSDVPAVKVDPYPTNEVNDFKQKKRDNKGTVMDVGEWAILPRPVCRLHYISPP